MPNLSIDQIYRKYGRKRVLEGASFSACTGSAVGIVGVNGSGKSTLLSILAGIQKADQGRFLMQTGNGWIDLLTDEKSLSSLVGYIPQGTPLMDELSARDNLLLWYGKEEMNKSLESGPLHILGIGEFLKTKVKDMSGGMKKRLSIGCAVAKDPPILLLDEACAALDLPCKKQILSYLRIHCQRGGNVILSTHDLDELSICRTVYVLKNGVLSLYPYDGNGDKLLEAIR